MDRKSLQKTANDISEILKSEVAELKYKVIKEKKPLSKDEATKLKLYSDILSVSFEREKNAGNVDWTADKTEEELEALFEAVR